MRGQPGGHAGRLVGGMHESEHVGTTRILCFPRRSIHVGGSVHHERILHSVRRRRYGQGYARDTNRVSSDVVGMVRVSESDRPRELPVDHRSVDVIVLMIRSVRSVVL